MNRQDLRDFQDSGCRKSSIYDILSIMLILSNRKIKLSIYLSAWTKLIYQ